MTRSGALIGYACVSTRDQLLDRQVKALEAAGCIRIFADKKSGKNAEREELRKALDYLRPGDTLVVSSLDRLGRSLQDLIAIVSGLRKGGTGFRSLKEAIDTTTPGGRLVFHVFAALAEFIRQLIVEGTHEGLDAARARGQRLGRPPAMTPEQVGYAARCSPSPTRASPRSPACWASAAPPSTSTSPSSRRAATPGPSRRRWRRPMRDDRVLRKRHGEVINPRVPPEGEDLEFIENTCGPC